MAAAFNKKRTFCRVDAEQTAQTTPYHQLVTEIVECPRYGRGQPKQDVLRMSIAMEYKLSAKIAENNKVLDRCRQLAGCFVLLSNVTPDGDDGCSAKRAYTKKASTHIPKLVSAVPLINRVIRGLPGISFSNSTKKAIRTIQNIFMTPTANKTNIIAQQQPTQ